MSVEGRGFDVLCQKGQVAKRQNEHYISLVRRFYPAYTISKSPALKRAMAAEICNIIKSRGGRFVREVKKGGPHKELSAAESKKKVQKALKDMKRQSKSSRAKKPTRCSQEKNQNASPDHPDIPTSEPRDMLVADAVDISTDVEPHDIWSESSLEELGEKDPWWRDIAELMVGQPDELVGELPTATGSGGSSVVPL